MAEIGKSNNQATGTTARQKAFSMVRRREALHWKRGSMGKAQALGKGSKVLRHGLKRERVEKASWSESCSELYSRQDDRKRLVPPGRMGSRLCGSPRGKTTKGMAEWAQARVTHLLRKDQENEARCLIMRIRAPSQRALSKAQLHGLARRGNALVY